MNDTMVEKEAQGPHGRIPLTPTLSSSEGEREKLMRGEHTHMNVTVWVLMRGIEPQLMVENRIQSLAQ